MGNFRPEKYDFELVPITPDEASCLVEAGFEDPNLRGPFPDPPTEAYVDVESWLGWLTLWRGDRDASVRAARVVRKTPGAVEALKSIDRGVQGDVRSVIDTYLISIGAL